MLSSAYAILVTCLVLAGWLALTRHKCVLRHWLVMTVLAVVVHQGTSAESFFHRRDATRRLLGEARLDARLDRSAIDAGRALDLHAGGALFVDVRPLELWRRARVAGAVHLPSLAGPIDRRARLGDVGTRTLVVYCSDATCPLDRTMARALISDGYADVRTLQGGLEAWEAAGGPLQRGAD